jgi:pimeloyl-ACP methyl ester carboxylesterase
MKRLRRVLVFLAIFAVTAFGALTWIASSRLICPPRRVLQDHHQDILANAREHGMRIESFAVSGTPCLLCEPLAQPGSAVKGNKLRAELQAQSVPLAPWGEIKATLVLLHGHKGCKEDHLPVAERFCAAGFRCLLVDLPGHGQNPEPFASFGKRESSLPGEVLRAAATRFQFDPSPAALFGISQGGAIVLQAAAQTDEQCFAVGELSSFAALDQVVTQQAKALFGPLSSMANEIVTTLVQQRAGYTPSEIRPVDAASKLTIPVLIGHGDADSFVTPDQAQVLYAAAPSTRKQFLTIPGAGHSNVLVTTAPVYATMTRFFWEALPR